MAFTPINTQEEFDAAIKDRLARDREKYEKYISPEDLEKIKNGHKEELDKLKEENESIKKQLTEKDSTIAERDAKIKDYETDSVKKRIVREAGLPDDAAGYLTGDDVEALKKSAEGLKAIIGDKPAAPLRDTETGPAGDLDAAYKGMLAGLKGENE